MDRPRPQSEWSEEDGRAPIECLVVDCVIHGMRDGQGPGMGTAERLHGLSLRRGRIPANVREAYGLAN